MIANRVLTRSLCKSHVLLWIAVGMALARLVSFVMQMSPRPDEAHTPTRPSPSSAGPTIPCRVERSSQSDHRTGGIPKMTRVAMELGASLLTAARRWVFGRDPELQRLEREGLAEGAWKDVGDALRQATSGLSDQPSRGRSSGRIIRLSIIRLSIIGIQSPGHDIEPVRDGMMRRRRITRGVRAGYCWWSSPGNGNLGNPTHLHARLRFQPRFGQCRLPGTCPLHDSRLHRLWETDRSGLLPWFLC